VFDRTEVVGYEVSPRRAKLHTNRGTVVNSAHVVVASGYEVRELLPDLPLRLNSTFALVSEPIEGVDRMYPNGLRFWDYDDPYLYGRLTDDRRLLVGGRDERYRNPTRRRRASPAKTRALAASVPKRAPRIGEIEVAYSWAGTFAETPDGLAYIGGHSSTPRCQFAPRYGGNGITYSAIAAEYLSDRIERATPHPAAAVFALERPNRAP
jgi:glycine/D-amino acid oxidase-like deaminating enzyme